MAAVDHQTKVLSSAIMRTRTPEAAFGGSEASPICSPAAEMAAVPPLVELSDLVFSPEILLIFNLTTRKHCQLVYGVELKREMY